MVTEITRKALEGLPNLTLSKIARDRGDEVSSRLADAASSILSSRLAA